MTYICHDFKGHIYLLILLICLCFFVFVDSEDGALSSAPISRVNSTASMSSVPLEDLEAQQRLILSQLEKEGDDSQDGIEMKVIDSIDEDESETTDHEFAVPDPPTPREGFVPPIPDTPPYETPPPLPAGTPPITPKNTPKQRLFKGDTIPVDSSEDECSTPNNSLILRTPGSSGSLSKSMTRGTPLLKHPSSVESLPDSSKFADGITDHIPYENLPNATGTYEKLRRTLAAIKDKK